MKTIDSHVTVRSADLNQWLVTADGLITACEGEENISFTVLIPRSGDSFAALTRKAVDRAIFLLQTYQGAPMKSI